MRWEIPVGCADFLCKWQLAMSYKHSKSGKTSSRQILLQNLMREGRWGEVRSLVSRMLAESPLDPIALRASIEVALGAGDYELASRQCERLCKVSPDDTWAHMNFGVCLAQLHRFDAAKAEFHHAECLTPDDPNVCGNLSSLYFSLQDYDRSLHYADKAVAGAPGNPSAHNSRGAALLKLERYSEALLSLAKAIELYPGDYYEDAVENLGMALHDMRRYAEAYACYEQILSLHPNDTGSLALLLHSALQICEWGGMEKRVQRLVACVRSEHPPGGIPPFVYLSVPGLRGSDHKLLASHAAKTMLSINVPDRPVESQLPALLPPRGRIRVGYLSADFHTHATAQLIVEVLEQHDRSRFEIFAYSYGPDDKTPMRTRMVDAFEHFVDLQDVPLAAAVDAIRQDQIDILVDLKGWTNGVRLELSAARPAPIIVSWLGYPGSLGLPGMADYIIGDRFVTPLEHSADYSELIVQLPHSYQPNDRRRQVSGLPSRSAVGLPETAPVFCSFNQTYKINREYFSAWCEILKQVAESVLWLLEPDELVAGNLKREMMALGVDPERLIFAPRLPLAEHLGRLQHASVALDTGPYGSHTTGSDALWVGVPMVTFPGETFASRVAASLLSAASVPELITNSWDEYIALAVRLGTDSEALARVKEKLVAGRATCPLFDSLRFTRSLETAYQQMIDDARAGRRETIVVRE